MNPCKRQVGELLWLRETDLWWGEMDLGTQRSRVVTGYRLVLPSSMSQGHVEGGWSCLVGRFESQEAEDDSLDVHYWQSHGLIRALGLVVDSHGMGKT